MMRWKVVLAVLIVLLLLGTILVTDVGKKYGSSIISLVGSFTNLISPTTTESRTFAITLTTDKSAFHGQMYDMLNTTFIGSGNYLYIKVDGGNEKIQDSTSVDLRINAGNGKFELTKEGTTRLNVNSNQIVLNAVERTRDKAYALEAEIQPNNFILSPIIVNRISFASVNGNLKIGTKTTASIDLSEASIEISNFAGFLQLNENQITLNGFSSKIVVNGQEVGISAQ